MIRDSEEFRKKATMYRRWRKKYEDYIELIKELEYEESKIPSAFPDTVTVGDREIAIPRTHGDPRQKEIRRLELIEHKHTLELARDDYLKKCQEVEEALYKLPKPFRALVVQIYIDRSKTIEQAADELGYAKSGMASRIYNALDKCLK